MAFGILPFLQQVFSPENVYDDGMEACYGQVGT
jgi:hypothetical protein